MTDKTDDPNGVLVLGDDPKTEKRIEKPKKYKVIILNDDFTPMDFVIQLLRQYFHHSLQVATQITLDVHRRGKGVAGVMSYELAETKVSLIAAAASNFEFPLRAIIEPDDSE